MSELKPKKVVEKGYTLEITSWENDGDNYKTEKCVFETEEAVEILNMAKKIWVSSNNGCGGK